MINWYIYNIIIIATHCGKFWKRLEYQTTLPSSWETCMQVKKQQVRTGHETIDWFRIRKGVCQGCILSPCLFNFSAAYIMWNAWLDESQARIKVSGRNTNLDSILKHKDITLPTKVCIVKAMVFAVVIYGCKSWTIKIADCQRIDAFKTVVLEKTPESSLDCKEIKLVNSKGSQCWIFIGRLMLKLKLLYFALLMQRANSLENTLILGKLSARGEGGDRGWDDWMASLIQ